MENYFWHPAFDNYPVVGVNWYAAQEFCKWRTDHLNQYREEKELALLCQDSASQLKLSGNMVLVVDMSTKSIPWESPYLRN